MKIPLDEAYKLASCHPLSVIEDDSVLELYSEKSNEQECYGGVVAFMAGLHKDSREAEVNAALLAHAFNYLPSLVHELTEHRQGRYTSMAQRQARLKRVDELLEKVGFITINNPSKG